MISLLRWVCLTLVFAVSSTAYAADSLISQVDRQTIAKDETLQLTVRYSGSSQRGEPNFSSLENQFDIISTSKSNHMKSINGRFTSYTEWAMTLFPKQGGKLIIPSFTFAGQVSDALEINVTEPKQAPAGTVKDVFIETTIDQDSVYVQEQVHVTYRLYFSVNLESVETEPLEIDNVLKETLPEARYNRTIKGKPYSIAEFSYALFPQTSGEFTIPALTWVIKIPKSGRNQGYFGFSGRYEMSRQRTEAKTITVKPRPDTFPKDKPWIPAKNLRLTESWSQSPEDLNVGEPSTRTLTLTAEGLLGSQLPQIWGGYESAEIKSYADKPELTDDKTDSGVSSTRIESAAVVVAQNGSFTMPAIRIPWWDVESDTLKYAEIPGRTLSASGAEVVSSTNNNVATMPQVESIADSELSNVHWQVRIWQWTSFLLLFITIALAVLLLRTRQTAVERDHDTTNIANEKTAWAQLKAACDANQVEDIRVALLNWAAYRWPASRVASLSDVAVKINDTSFTEQTSNIDSSLYGKAGNAEVDGKLIMTKIKQFLQKDSQNASDTQLQHFYVTS